MAATDRKTGKYGSLYLHANASPVLNSATKYADVYNWRFETNVEMLDCTRKGEGYRRFMPGAGTSRFTADKFIQTLSSLLILADDDLATAALGPVVRVAFKLITVGTEATGTTFSSPNLNVADAQIIQGFGWVERAYLEAPFDDAIREGFEMQVDGEWEFVTTT